MQMARPTDPQASINAYLQKTRERFVRPFRQPLRSGNLSTVASISLKQDPWAPVFSSVNKANSDNRGKESFTAAWSSPTQSPWSGHAATNVPVLDSPLMDSPRVMWPHDGERIEGENHPIITDCYNPSVLRASNPFENKNDFATGGRQTGNVGMRAGSSLTRTHARAKPQPDWSSELAAGTNWYDSSGVSYLQETHTSVLEGRIGAGKGVVFKPEVNPHPLAGKARSTYVVASQGASLFVRQQGLLPDIDDELDAGEALRQRDGRVRRFGNCSPVSACLGLSAASDDRCTENAYEGDWSVVQSRSSAEGRGMRSDSPVGLSYVGTRESDGSRIGVFSDHDSPSLSAQSNPAVRTAFSEENGQPSQKRCFESEELQVCSEEADFTMAEFLETRKQVKELQRQLLAAKSMLVDALGNSSQCNSLVASPREVDEKMSEELRALAKSKSPETKGLLHEPAIFMKDNRDPSWIGKNLREQNALLLAQNLELKRDNEALRNRVQMIEKCTKSAPMQKNEDAQTHLLADVKEMRKTLELMAADVRHMQSDESAWCEKFDVFRSFVDEPGGGHVETVRPYYINSQTAGVSWCLWAVPDDPAESVWHVNSFNDDETLSSAKGCEPQNSGGSAARSDALEHRRGSDSATAASALGFKQASLGQVALARSTKAPAKSIHGKLKSAIKKIGLLGSLSVKQR